MEITRSIGYVQIYFGIFIILTGLFAGFLAANISNSVDRSYSGISRDADFDSLSIEEKIYERQQETLLIQLHQTSVYYSYQIITNLIIAMIILIALGVHATLHGIVHTRKGNPEHLHPKKKLVHNIIYAILLSIALLVLISLIML